MTLTPAGSLRTTGTSLEEVLSKVAAPAPKSTKAVAPKKVVLSDEQRLALKTLPSKLAGTDLPDKPRELTAEEIEEFIPLFDEVKDAKKALVQAEESLKEAFANHMDTQAPRNAETDKNGHKIAEGIVESELLAIVVKRELKGGKAAPLTLADLERLEADGDIDHKTFLAMTRQTRSVDEVAVMEQLANRPELLDALKKVAVLTPKSTAISIRARD